MILKLHWCMCVCVCQLGQEGTFPKITHCKGHTAKHIHMQTHAIQKIQVQFQDHQPLLWHLEVATI